jgi:hypothetical protein
MKNKITGLLMLAAFSLVAGKCFQKEEVNADFSLKINEVGGKPTEAELVLSFAKGTNLDDYSFKFDGTAFTASTKAGNKDVKGGTTIKLSDLGKPKAEDSHTIAITGLQVGEIKATLLKGTEEVKDKSNKVITNTFTVKSVVNTEVNTVSIEGEVENGVGSVTISGTKKIEAADLDKLSLNFDKKVKYSKADATTIALKEDMLKDGKITLNFGVVETTEATLESKDAKKFVVETAKATLEIVK